MHPLPGCQPHLIQLEIVPRSNQLLDIGLDWIRQDPEPSRAVLEGILFGRTAPPREERQRLTMPAFVVGHPSDPLHPFSDADILAETGDALGNFPQAFTHLGVINAALSLRDSEERADLVSS